MSLKCRSGARQNTRSRIWARADSVPVQNGTSRVASDGAIPTSGPSGADQGLRRMQARETGVQITHIDAERISGVVQVPAGMCRFRAGRSQGTRRGVVSASAYRYESDTTSRSEGDVKSGPLEPIQATSIGKWCQCRLIGESPTRPERRSAYLSVRSPSSRTKWPYLWPPAPPRTETWRREWDLNPRGLASQSFSRASHSAALPSLRSLRSYSALISSGNGNHPRAVQFAAEPSPLPV
jgi:hypothetical protein